MTQVVATAGHVDHGKSTLVRALTGREPDRWDEERRRGLTIDLGFAWMTLPDGERVAFVDVPGHERFVPNMLAGIGPVPAVMFVVAADEGWMPQSTEHLAALDALGVTRGLLVITRADLADPELAEEEARTHLAGTSLAEVPAVPVSGVTGEGIDDLHAALGALVAGLPTPDPDDDVRLWIDRAFTIGGAGLVVTGTLPSGRIRAGDRLTLASTGREVRVRGLQTLEEPADEVTGVARVAVNLRGTDRPHRGDALLARGAWHRTDQADCLLPPGADPPGELMLHVGAAAVPARVRPLGDRTVRLQLAHPLPLRYGDRLLLRNPGRHEIAAGATVLDPDPPPLRRRGAARDRATELTRIAEAREAPDAAGPQDAEPQKAGPRAAGRPPATREAGAREEPGARAAGAVRLREVGFARAGELRSLGFLPPGDAVLADWYADPDLWAGLPARLREAARAWAGEHPLEPGLPEDVALRALGLPDRGLLTEVTRRAGLTAADGRISAQDRDDGLPAKVAQAVAAVLKDLRDDPFAAPDANRLARLGLGPRELAAAVRAGRLLKVADGIVLAPDAITRARPVLSDLPQPFALSDARKALGTTRRVAVPFLELLDRRGVTVRLPDDTRRVTDS